MTTRNMLGSFVSTPVLRDIFSFCDLEDKIHVVLCSPSAGYNILNRNFDFDLIKFGYDQKNNLTISIDIETVFNTDADCDSSKAVAYIHKILGMCRSLKDVSFAMKRSSKCSFDAHICEKLERFNLRSLGIYGRIDVSYEQFLRITRNVGKIALYDCKVSNDLVTDEMFNLFCEKKVECVVISPSRASYNTQSSMQTTVSDCFLDKMIHSDWYLNFISFGDFCTKFTIEGIKRFLAARPKEGLLFYPHWNFGVLNADQAGAALQFANEMDNEAPNESFKTDREIITINGQRTVRYCNRDFKLLMIAVALDTVPPAFTADIDDEAKSEMSQLNIFFSPEFSGDFSKSEVVIRYETFFAHVEYLKNKLFITVRYKNVFRIECKFPGDEMLRTLIITDIDEQKAEQLVKTFINKCGLIGKLSCFIWCSVTVFMKLSSQFKLIRSTETTLKPASVVEFFKDYPHIAGNCLKMKDFPPEYLTDKFVISLLLINITIDVVWTGKEELGVTTLSDELLLELAETQKPHQFSVEGYTTSFTIEGIKKIFFSESPFAKNDVPIFKWNFGKLEKSQEVKAVRFLSEIQMDPDNLLEIQDSTWNCGFLLAFKISKNIGDNRVIHANVAIAGQKQVLVDEKANVVSFSHINENNYQAMLMEDRDLAERYICGKLRELNLLNVFISMYEYHLTDLRFVISRRFWELNTDSIFEDRFFGIPYDQQAYILNVVFKHQDLLFADFDEDLFDWIFPRD